MKPWRSGRRPSLAARREPSVYLLGFGRSLRSAENSGGPSISLRMRRSRSSAGSDGSSNWLICFAARSLSSTGSSGAAAGATSVGLLPNPSMTSRPMASDRTMPWASAHASISAVSVSDIFTALTTSRAEVGRRIGWSGRFLGVSGTFKSADHRNRLPLAFFTPDDLIPIKLRGAAEDRPANPSPDPAVSA